ncbi:hypothetical protein ACJJTC_016571 [Scirpophaga incertulas]
MSWVTKYCFCQGIFMPKTWAVSPPSSTLFNLNYGRLILRTLLITTCAGSMLRVPSDTHRIRYGGQILVVRARLLRCVPVWSSSCRTEHLPTIVAPPEKPTTASDTKQNQGSTFPT